MNDIKTIITMIKQLLYIMNKKQKKVFIVLFFIILVGSGFELLGVSAIIPFIYSLMSPENMTQNVYVAFFMNLIGIDSNFEMVLIMGVLIAFVYIIKNVYLIFSSRCQIKFRCQFQKDLSTKMLETYMKRPYSYFVNNNSGVILRGVGGAVAGVYDILDNFSRLVAEALTSIMIGLFIIMVDPIMAVGVLTLSLLCFLGVTVGFKRKISILGKRQWDAMALTNKYSFQAIHGNKEIKVMQRSKYFVKAYEDASEISKKATIENSFIAILPERVIETVCICGIITVVCFRVATGVDMVHFVPKLAAFAVAAFRILPSISRMTGHVNLLIYWRPSLEETYINLKEVNEYEEEKLAFVRDETEQDLVDCKFVDKVVLENVTWSYDNSDKDVLHELFLDIHKGESIALIGHSGAGKTTLADVVLGLLPPQRGIIKVDGIDIFTIPKQWAKLIGYVPQSIFLIDDTIRANIAFGLPAERIDEEKVWKALEEAQLKDFVETLPDKLDTVVGERGVRFSGGQRQRIAIARALYENPEILILDEATSALDNETENAVMQSIDALQGRKTLIIVAHRLSTIRNCDTIYEIKDGKAIKRDKKEIIK